MTEQPYSGIALLSSYGRGGGKRIPKQSLLLIIPGHLDIHACDRKKEKKSSISLKLASWNVRTLLDATGPELEPGHGSPGQ